MQKTIHTSEYSELIDWLRTQRKQKKMTMRELGAKLGVIHSWVGKIEQGERRLDLVEYLKICKALKVDPHEGLNLLQKALSSSKKAS